MAVFRFSRTRLPPLLQFTDRRGSPKLSGLMISDAAQTSPPPLRDRFRLHVRTVPVGPFRVEGSSFRIHWPGCPDPEARLHQVLTALRAPDRPLKTSAINTLCRMELDEDPFLVKEFRLPSVAKRIQYLPRHSRARRCWATARTFTEAEIPTPEPLAFIECRRRGLPISSCYVCRFREDAAPARRWIKAWYHQRSAPEREAFRRDLLRCLTNLYRREVYHADTKTSNMLLANPEDPTSRRFLWIDLDCVSFGRRPTRRHLLRNLVQLNGSIGSKASEEDRMAFLMDLATDYPGLRARWVPHHIRTKTGQRLQRELDGRCGP